MNVLQLSTLYHVLTSWFGYNISFAKIFYWAQYFLSEKICFLSQAINCRKLLPINAKGSQIVPLLFVYSHSVSRVKMWIRCCNAMAFSPKENWPNCNKNDWIIRGQSLINHFSLWCSHILEGLLRVTTFQFPQSPTVRQVSRKLKISLSHRHLIRAVWIGDSDRNELKATEIFFP